MVVMTALLLLCRACWSAAASLSPFSSLCQLTTALSFSPSVEPAPRLLGSALLADVAVIAAAPLASISLVLHVRCNHASVHRRPQPSCSRSSLRRPSPLLHATREAEAERHRAAHRAPATASLAATRRSSCPVLPCCFTTGASSPHRRQSHRRSLADDVPIPASRIFLLSCLKRLS
jgi:hypothetical protein